MGQVRGAGLRHGSVRLADGTYHDIDAIVSLEGEPEFDTTDVEGDDTTLASFASFPTESLSVTANSLSTELIAAITGQTVTSISTTGKVGQEVGLGGEGHANPPYVEVAGFTVGRLKADDTAQTIKRVFHKVQLRVSSLTQEKDGEFSVEFEGTAFSTTTDVTGAALPSRRTETVGYTAQTVDSIIAEQEAAE